MQLEVARDSLEVRNTGLSRVLHAAIVVSIVVVGR